MRSNSRPKETSVSVTGIGTTGNCISMFRIPDAEFRRRSSGTCSVASSNSTRLPRDGSRAFDLRNDRFEVGRADRRRVRAGRRFHLLVYTASPSRRQSVFITDLHGEAFRPPRKTLRFSANKIGTGENPIPIPYDRRSPVEESCDARMPTAAYRLPYPPPPRL